MNGRNIQVFVVFGVMVALTAGVLARARASYVLGTPGVKLADIPMYAVMDNQTNIVSPISVPLPEVALDFTSEALPITAAELQMLPPDTVYGRRLYQAADGFQTMISVVVMGTDRTSIHKPQYCLTGQGQSIVKTELISVPVSRPHPYNLEMMKLTTEYEGRTKDGGRVPMREYFLYWFVADDQLTPSHGERMWLMGKDLLTKGLLQRWAYVAYWGICNPGQEDALLERMKGFLVATVPEFQITTGERALGSVALETPPQLAIRE